MDFDFEQIYNISKNSPVILCDKSDYITKMHYQAEYELLYFVSGNAEFILNGKKYFVKNGETYFIDLDREYFIKNADKKAHYISLIFSPSVFGSSNDTTRQLFNQIIIDSKIILSETILEKIRKTAKENFLNEIEKEFAIKNLIYEIFFHIIKTHQFAPLPQTSKIEKKHSIEDGILYIKKHFKENITLSDLLDTTNYSKSHFIRLFKLNTGMNYTDYLNRYRIKHSCRDLIFSDKNITEIATENGFNNIQYFSKIFKKYMECSPKQYQKKWKFK